MNAAKLYSQIAGRTLNDESKEITKEREAAKQEMESAGRTQLKINWLNSTITQEILASFGKEAEDLLDRAVSLASTYHQHQNHHEIIKCLIRVETLQNLIQKVQV